MTSGEKDDEEKQVRFDAKFKPHTTRVPLGLNDYKTTIIKDREDEWHVVGYRVPARQKEDLGRSRVAASSTFMHEPRFSLEAETDRVADVTLNANISM